VEWSGLNPYSGGILKRNRVERVLGPNEENPEQQGCCSSGEPSMAAHSKGRGLKPPTKFQEWFEGSKGKQIWLRESEITLINHFQFATLTLCVFVGLSGHIFLY
jgi:hypothetical protein